MIDKILLIKYDKKLYLYTSNSLYIKHISTYDYLNNICIKYGSSLNGRLEAFKRLTKTKYKPSVIISNKYNIYYICTHSIKSNFNYLINYQELLKFKSVDNFNTCLYFKNNISFTIPVNYRIIKRQISNIQYYLNNMTFN